MKSQKTLLFNDTATQELLERVAELIIFDINSGNLQNLAFIGIQSKGVPPAQRVAAIIAEKSNYFIPVGMLDISMYRDDIGKRKALPHIHATEIPFDLDDKAILIFDDVLVDLDKNRNNNIIELLNQQHQIFIATPNKEIYSYIDLPEINLEKLL